MLKDSITIVIVVNRYKISLCTIMMSLEKLVSTPSWLMYWRIEVQPFIRLTLITLILVSYR